jgi:hypothetical protein
MTHKVLLEKFLLFEDENNLFDIRVEDIPIWEYTRFDIFHLLKNELVAVHHSVGIKKMSKFKRAFKNYVWNTLFKNPFQIDKNVELLVFNHSRRREVDSFYQDIHTDPFLPHLKMDYAVIESVFNWGHLKPAKTSNLYYFDAIELPGAFKRILSSKEPTQGDLEKIDKILSLIEERWGEIHLAYTKMTIIRLIRQYKSTYLRVEKLLRKKNPRAILSVVSYAFNNQIVTEVAHKLNIKVIEVQHGIAGPLHIGYNFLGNPSLKTLPDYFLAWGDYWIKNTRMAIPKENIKIVGYPYLDNFRQKTKVERNEKQLVFLSQMSGEVGRFAEELATLLPDHKIIFKAHPTEYTVVFEKYTYLKNKSNVEIIATDNKPLYEIFQESNFVFGVNSTAMIEALGFCNTIFVLKFAGWEYFEDMADNESFVFISSVEEAVTQIKSGKRFRSTLNLDQFFARDATAKTCKFLETF